MFAPEFGIPQLEVQLAQGQSQCSASNPMGTNWFPLES
jgi:hypothetical protein